MTYPARQAVGMDFDRQATPELLALMAMAALAGVYFVFRPAGLWAETDSGAMSQATRVVMDRATLAPQTLDAYYNGYGYQAVAMTIVMFTGLSIPTLQQELFPLISAALVLPAWALYREFTGSGRVATLAVLLLMLVPEHLFAVLRASHERLDRAFLMTALWLLVRSARVPDDRTQYLVHIGAFLVMAWALIATNALFGMSLIAALVTALAASWIARRVIPGLRDVATSSGRLLVWPAAGAAVLIVIFVAFVYPPILPTIRELSNIPGRLISLITTGGGSFDPYAGILAAWVSPTAYLLLSLVNFVVLVASMLFFVWLGFKWLRGGRPESFGVWMLWLFFAAFAAQGAASIVSDRTGSLAANVQYRAFAVFATVAAPMLALGLSRWEPRRVLKVAGAAVVALAVIGASVGGLVKSTLDPTVSNKWIFYTAPEIESLVWIHAHWPATTTWIGPDDRLAAAYEMTIGGLSHSAIWDYDELDDGTRSFLISDVIVEQVDRLSAELPELDSTNIVYDNGDVQVHRVSLSVTPRDRVGGP